MDDIHGGFWIEEQEDHDNWTTFLEETMIKKLIAQPLKLTNSMAYGTRRFNAAFTRALQ